MFNFFKNLFTSNKQQIKETVYIPQPGDKYYFRDLSDKSPFPKKNYRNYPTTIIDCKNGWVRYRIGGIYGAFNDERMELSIFLTIYTKLD